MTKTRQRQINSIGRKIISIRPDLCSDDIVFLIENYPEDFIEASERYSDVKDMALYVLENNGF